MTYSKPSAVSILPIFRILATIFAVMWKGLHIRHLIFQKCDTDKLQIYQRDYKRYHFPVVHPFV